MTGWERLRAAGLADGPEPGAAPAGQPWYVLVMLGAAGWLSGMLLILGMGFVIFGGTRGLAATGSVGAVCCIGAVCALRFFPRSVFIDQGCLAALIAGQGMIAWTLADAADGWPPWAAAAQTAVAAALVAAAPGFLHRLLAAGIAVAAWAIWLGDHHRALIGPLAAAGAAMLVWRPWTVRHLDATRPVGWGLLLAALAMAAVPAWNVGRDDERIDAAYRLTEAVAAIAGAALALRSRGAAIAAPSALVAMAAMAAIAWAVPGGSAALILAMIGIAQGERPALATGCLALAALVGCAYWRLDATLLAKAGWLAAAGAAALLARAALRRWRREGDAHA